MIHDQNVRYIATLPILGVLGRITMCKIMTLSRSDDPVGRLKIVIFCDNLFYCFY